MRTLASLLLLILSLPFSQAQNLITNPGAESDPLGSGWTSVATGTSCGTGSNWRIEGGVTTYPAAQDGTYIFYSGCGSISGEIYQDIDVTAYAASIDAGSQTFTFTGYTHSFNQTPADGARIIIEYRNISSTVLGSYDTGFTTNTGGWTVNSDSRNAPVGTRTIRVRLMSEANNGSSVDGYIDNLSLTTSPVLPIDLLYFSAEKIDQGRVQLSWETTLEENNDFFTVERTADGIDWEIIDMIDGAGSSSKGLRYQSLDNYPLPSGIAHYRLKQTDFDGGISYSHTTTVNMGDLLEAKAYIFPNPATNILTLVSDGDDLSQVKLFTLHGAEVINYSATTDPDNSRFQIDISNLSTGLYVIRTSTAYLKFSKY